MQKQVIELSTNIVFKTILILLGFWFLYLVRDVIALLVVAVIFVSAIDPAVDFLQKKKIPRSISVLAFFLLIIILLSASFSFIIPPITRQVADLAQNYPAYSQKFGDFFGDIQGFILQSHINIDTASLLGDFGKEISQFSKNIFSTTLGVFSGIISTIVVFSLTFYMAVEEDGIKKFVSSIVPDRYRDYAEKMTGRIKKKIGQWMVGQLALMFLVGFFSFIGLYIVDVPYALILAIFAGIMEIVPYIGPIVSAVPGVVLGFLVSPMTGFLALGVYVAVQQLENHIIAPQVMKKAVGLSPITVILVLLIGAKIGGTMGAILAIPVGTALSLFVKDFMNARNNGKE
jgi:predicted PurR-regulated permease PerM